MKTHTGFQRLRASVLVAHGALGCVAVSHAQSADPALVEQTVPKNTVEVGGTGVSSYAAKANEYSGVGRKGAIQFGRFELRGGGAYDGPDAYRWTVRGEMLGPDERALDMDYGLQGTYRVKLGYEEQHRSQSDTFQTPYTGIGSNNLTLPANWVTVVVPRLSGTTPNARGISPDVTASNGIVAGVSTPPTPAQASAAAALQGADLPAFRSVDLFTQRTHHGLDLEQLLDARWRLTLSLANDHKEGLKAQAAHSHATGGDATSILPAPINQDDRKVGVGLSYTGDKLHMQAAYKVSSFENAVPSISWNMWSGPGITQTLSTAPNNMFEKALLSGSYQATPATRVVGDVSYARSRQNDAFLSDVTAPLVPQASAHALVVNESAGLKLLNRTTKALSLSAGYKFERRDNRTPVNTYAFYDNQETPSGASPFQYLYPSIPGMGTNINVAANTPYSNTVQQAGLDADYQIQPGDHVKAGWNTSKTERECDGSWVACINATNATEHTLKADWFGHLGESLTARVGLAASRRKVDYNENSFLARVPLADQTPVGAPAGSTAYDTLVAAGLNGYGPALGLAPAATPGSALAFYFPLNNALGNTFYGYRNRISELLGMRRFDQADRERNKLRSSITWQATEKIELQGGFDYSRDHYSNSVYGLQKATQEALNLDATYVGSDDFSVSLFASAEEQRLDTAGNTYTANSTATSVNGATALSGGCFATLGERNAHNKIDPCLDWHSATRDRTTTLGASFTRNKLWHGKVDLQGSAVYSEARTAIDVTGGSYVNNPYAGVAGAANSAIAAYYIPATALPTAVVKSLELRLSGLYRIDRERAFRLSYGYQRLRSHDWAYEGLQDGALTQVLPTRELAPNYNVHSVGVSYVASFR